jgi:spermidine/putrescine transport system ATP-binding protein
MEERATTEAAVSAERVSKVFGSGQEAVRAVDDVSVAIRKNEFFTLLERPRCSA